MTNFGVKHLVCYATVVAAVTAMTISLLTISASPAINNGAESSASLLIPSEFVDSVLRKLLPAGKVDLIESKLRLMAFALNDNDDEDLPLYRSKHNKTKSNKHKAKKPNKKPVSTNTTAPAAFRNWLQNSLHEARLSLQHTNRMQLHDDEVEVYRVALAQKLEKVENSVNTLSKLHFTQQQVDAVADFLRFYFTAKNNPSLNPHDILKAFGQALENAKQHDGGKHYRKDITAEVAGPKEEAAAPKVEAAASSVSSAAGSSGGIIDTIEADAIIAAEDAYLALNETMSILDYINDIPPPILTLLGVVFPPLNMLINGIEAATCFWDNKGALTFSSWFAWPPFLNCFVNLVNLLPLGPDMSTALQAVIQLFGSAIGWTGEYETGANFTLTGTKDNNCACP